MLTGAGIRWQGVASLWGERVRRPNPRHDGASGISVLCGDGQLLRLTRLMDADGVEYSGESLVQPAVFKLSSTFSATP